MPSPEAAESVPVHESGDPLVTPEGLRYVDAYHALGLGPPRPPLLRRGLVDRLLRARDTLPDGLDLVLLDTTRTRAFQAGLLAHYSGSGDVSGYVSDPEHGRLVPPHVTGGAVDLTLGAPEPLALGTDYDDFGPRAHADWWDDVDRDEAMALRALLFDRLLAQGLAPYPLEWWHWSYGDQWWAAYRGCDRSLYAEAPAGEDT